MTPTAPEPQPAPVPEATQAGDIRARWAWTEPGVWTDRMLTALEQGVKGGIWFSLIDKVYAPRTLAAAWQHVKANQGAAGVDRVTVVMYERDLDTNLARVSQQLRDGTYRPAYLDRQTRQSGAAPLGDPDRAGSDRPDGAAAGAGTNL